MIRFHDACGTTGKTVAARLLPDTDLIEGIEEVCKKMILNIVDSRMKKPVVSDFFIELSTVRMTNEGNLRIRKKHLYLL